MAKRRRLNKSVQDDRRVVPAETGTSLVSGVSGLNPSGIATALLAGSVVYVTYYPSDSVAVEKGDALWLALLAVVIATIACAARSWHLLAETMGRYPDRPSASDTGEATASQRVASGRSIKRMRMVALATAGVNLIPWLLAGWMMLAAFASSPPGNLRMASNEAWFWITAACLFTSARVLLVSLSVRQNLVGLLVICACGLSVHGMHQYAISLPENRAEYRRDPEAVLQKAMLDAPPGSTERMVFENRLMDGGPTATFALANSLAAVLLVSVVLAAGMVVFGWGLLHPMQRSGWGLAAVLCASCLMAARSRSATLAMLVGVALLLVAASQIFQRQRRFLGWGLFGLLLVGTGGAAFLALFGNREWFEEAPASLAFRFQYWRSTWQMVLDHPWFGAGPGNFQAIYERYREASATEQIAEPHNFLVETVAAGGFVGLGLLVLGGLCVLAVAWFRESGDWGCRVDSGIGSEGSLPKDAGLGRALSHSPADLQGAAKREDADQGLSRWVWLGALVAWGMIWLLGWISRQPPDVDASVYVVPVVISIGWLVATTIHKISSRDLDVVLVIAMGAISLHLMISGGWTVPGVAMLIWLGVGMWIRNPQSISDGQGRAGSPVHMAVVVTIGAGLLVTLWAFSLRPVEQQRLWMTRAADAQARGRSENAREALVQAVEADRWSPDATLWLADFYRWQLVRDPASAELRQRWEAVLDESKRRSGEDPAVYRMIGGQQMHVFQKWGRPRDLAAAADSFEAALRWSPANQWMFAQMAAIDRSRGNQEAAETNARTAATLSQLGGNIERALSRQMVYIPGKLGAPADRGPVRVAADKLLAEPNDDPSRISAD